MDKKGDQIAQHAVHRGGAFKTGIAVVTVGATTPGQSRERSAVLLKSFEVDEIRKRIDKGKDISDLRSLAPSPSLGAALELACARKRWSGTNPAVAQLIEKWACSSDVLRRACGIMDGEAIPRPPVFAKPRWELWRIATRDDWLDKEAGLYQERFSRSLRSNNFPPPLARALTKCFSEMVDNILQHSTDQEGEPAQGVAGYHVEDGWMTFAAADTGRGVLASLRTNAIWANVKGAEAALTLTVREGASRRKTLGARDGGLLALHQALLNRNSRLRFRSDDGLLEIDGTGPTHHYSSGENTYMPGFQLSVTCAPRSEPAARPVPPIGT